MVHEGDRNGQKPIQYFDKAVKRNNFWLLAQADSAPEIIDVRISDEQAFRAGVHLMLANFSAPDALLRALFGRTRKFLKALPHRPAEL